MNAPTHTAPTTNGNSDSTPRVRGDAPPLLGRYRCKLVNLEITGSREKNTPQVEIDVEVWPSRQLMTARLSFHEKALEITVRQLRALGWKSNNIRDIVTHVPKGLEARVTIGEGEFTDSNGKTHVRAEIKSLDRAMSLEGAELDALAAVIGSKIAENPKLAARAADDPENY